MDPPKPLASVGLITDIHYADKLPQGTRCFRQSLAKVDYAFSQLLPLKPDRLVHLGDLVDSWRTDEAEEAAARAVTKKFRDTNVPFHFVMGNHCLSAMDKKRYAEVTGTAGRHEAFDIGGARFICLDACFTADGKPYAHGKFDYRDTFIPASQLDWLGDQLRDASGPCVVLVHQLLDGLPGMSAVNHASVRAVLNTYGNVAAVIQGHYHLNRFSLIDGIPYTVMRSVVDGPQTFDCGFSSLSVYSDGSVKIAGFARQLPYAFSSLRARSMIRRWRRGH